MLTNFKFNRSEGISADFDDVFIRRDIFSSGNLWGWGSNGYVSVGDGTITSQSSPVQVAGTSSIWKMVDDGGGSIPQYFAAGIRTDGTLWTWGSNYYGQLGVGAGSGYRSSPVQVGTLTDWKQVVCGYDGMAAIKTDGSLWTWGGCFDGQLGDSTTSGKSSPVQIGTLYDWKYLNRGGFEINSAIKTNGTLWIWGYNSVGQLGLGDTASRSTPVQVGTLTNWKQVVYFNNSQATACAIKTDGTLWAWGSNSDGQLGLNDFIHRSSPVQVGTLTDWKSISSFGTSGSVAAVKTDGTLWTWGRNSSAQLGLGDNIHRSSPTQVGSLTNWKEVVLGGGHALAIKTDGTLWTWGQNSDGQLGRGNLNWSSSPIQIGVYTDWKRASGGVSTSHGIREIY